MSDKLQKQAKEAIKHHSEMHEEGGDCDEYCTDFLLKELQEIADSDVQWCEDDFKRMTRDSKWQHNITGEELTIIEPHKGYHKAEIFFKKSLVPADITMIEKIELYKHWHLVVDDPVIIKRKKNGKRKTARKKR